VLWTAPGLALLAGIGTVLIARRRRPDPPEPLSEAEQRRVADLMKS
jgi:cytochrome c-type biogenesis protein CcmH/NrfF